MKKATSLSLLAALAATGIALGAPAYTTPVGYTTQVLSQGFNLTGLGVHAATIVAGTFTNVNGTSLTISSAATAAAGRLYVLEITSGSLAGVIAEVPSTSISGSTITTVQDLQAAGLTTGTSFKLRLAPTLEEIFTTTPLSSGGVLVASLGAANADIVWIPTGTGTYDKYFLRGGAFQRITGTSTFVAAPNIPVVYVDGILIEKKTTASAALTVSGEIKTGASGTVLSQGFNLVSVVAPVGLTLRTAGLDSSLTPSLGVANADIVWIQNPTTLAYEKYFRHPTGGWRSVSAPTVNLAVNVDPPLSSAIFIERKASGSVNLKLNVPSGYSSL